MIRPVPFRRLVAATVLVALLTGCGDRVVTSDHEQKTFLDSVYSQAPGIGQYRSARSW